MWKPDDMLIPFYPARLLYPIFKHHRHPGPSGRRPPGGGSEPLSWSGGRHCLEGRVPVVYALVAFLLQSGRFARATYIISQNHYPLAPHWPDFLTFQRPTANSAASCWLHRVLLIT